MFMFSTNTSTFLKQLYNMSLRRLPSPHGAVSVMSTSVFSVVLAGRVCRISQEDSSLFSITLINFCVCVFHYDA